ncbi:MAG: hypothetical protein GEU78_08035 [Actinobacteria bacterium]|nr:hypothetical protein [Actinomycetota bacterium]
MPSNLPLDTLGKQIAANVTKGDQYADKAEQFYKAAGLYLIEAKERVKKTNALTWSQFLRINCSDLSRQRAHEYIQIADGRTTLAAMRATKNESVQQSRAQKREAADLIAETRPVVHNVVDNRPDYLNEINERPEYDDTPLSSEDLGAELLLAASTLRQYTGDFDWKAIAEGFTKSDIEWIERAIKEIKAYV